VGEATYEFYLTKILQLYRLVAFCNAKWCGKLTLAVNDEFTLLWKCKHCHYETCPKCRWDSHAPVDCFMKDRWELFTAPAEERLRHENTKRCPFCNVIIERSQGSNCMRCMRCKGTFCWVCLRNWEFHGRNFMNCNFYDATTDPYRPMPDNVSPELLGLFNAVFLQYELMLSRLLEDETLENKIQERIANDGTATDIDKVPETIKSFVSELNCGMTNVMWAQARLFFTAFDIVKTFPVEQQKDLVLNFKMNVEEQKPYLLQKFYADSLRKSLDECLNIVADTQSSIRSGTPLEFSEFKQKYEQLKSARIDLLKHTDPRYQ
jgi:hypothetical protein